MKKLMSAALLALQILLIAGLASTAQAVSIGVSPGRIDFNSVLKGGYAEKTLTVSTNSGEQLVASITTSGETSDWLYFEPNTTSFVLSSSVPYKVKVIVRPPKDAKNDTYSGKITFTTERFGNLTSRAGGFVKTGVSIGVELRITGQEQAGCSSGSIDISDAEYSEPILVQAKVINSGNVRLRPEIQVEVWDQQKTTKVLQRSVITEEILPTAEKTVTARIPNSLETGQYWAEVFVKQCASIKTKMFDIAEKGTISDKGELSGIKNPNWAFVNDTVPIEATFANNGNRPVAAVFKAGIYLEDKLILPIQSEELTVSPGQQITFRTYFSPEKPGRYVITGRVVYNKKLSYEQSSILSINPRPEYPETKPNILPLIIYIAITATLVFMIRKIYKSKTH